MAMGPDEVLVLFDAESPDAGLLEAVRRHGAIIHRLPPRIAIVRLAGQAHALPEVEGSRWFRRPVPADVVASLADPLRLFVAAWNGRAADKARPGDGLAWDSPGYEPPDGPGTSDTASR